ncbi:hypothetical protein [Salirhabdus salicampi]|uniref:hypothetical protein n=1 Tax=Salirhabdus salicampi TaxID=476102 RepID=UPI0020C28CA0|nr:hypothetical protein [Salirhabdus salicampi]MCP8617020.1 hypothetical protein [Salirhabdus salicampi]
MGKFYRYKLPSWLRNFIFVMERCTLPIMIYQLGRTLLFPSSLDVFLTALWVGLFLAFYFEWF